MEGQPLNLTQPPPHPEKARILSAARAHFFVHGFRGVTMDDLAAELGMSKRTLYAHYPGKIDLVQAVMKAKMAEAKAALAAVSVKDAADSARHFAAALETLLATLRRQMEEISPAFVRDIRREAPELFDDVQTFRRQLVQEHFGALLTAGRKAGCVRDDIAIPLLVEILVGTVDAIVNPAKVDELGLSPKEAYLAVISVLMEGMLVRKGRAK